MWNLYHNDTLVLPLLYSTDKGQDTVIREILETFESYNVVFLHASVGSGKSACGLSVANELGGGIVVVPTKTLQDQYVRDYCEGEYKIRKKNGGWMRISDIKGRSNFDCLYDEGRKCHYKSLPCIETLQEEVTRLELASNCPYYSPLIRSSLESEYRDVLKCEFESLRYDATGGSFSVLRRDEVVCPYYEQYKEYVESDVILMNSALWMIETIGLKRKPKKEIEIIDEGDAFLDSLSLKKTITLKYINKIEEKLRKEKKFDTKDINEFLLIKDIFLQIAEKPYDGDISSTEKEFLIRFVKFLDTTIEEGGGNKYKDILGFIDKCYVSVTKKDIEYFIPEPEVVVDRILKSSSDKIMFMSATFQSQDVLERIFGFDDFCFVEAESKFPGTVYLRSLGTEGRVTYKTWQNEEFRRAYHRNLVSAIRQSEKPCLVTVHAFKYLPENIQKALIGNGTVTTKDGSVSFSTVMKRGSDLKDDKCRSIVMLKFPFPNINDPILKAMKVKLGEKSFWKYYHDIAKREFIQIIGRGVRHNDDWVEVWSPDKSVHGFIGSLWKGDIMK